MAFKLFDERKENRLKTNQLVEKNQVMENILEHFPGCVFWKDLNSVYLGCNSAEAEAAGLSSPAEIVGKSDFELKWTDHTADFYRNTDKEVMNSGKPMYHIEYSYHDKNGNLVCADTSKVPLIDKDGNVTGVFGVAVDITDRKRAEDLLKEEKQRLQNVLIGRPARLYQG